MPVMRKPDRTKNRSTPRSPYLVTPTMARSTQLPGSIWPTKWNTRTIRTARPRTPSSAGKCPRRLNGGPALATAGALNVGAALGLEGVITGAYSQIARACRSPPRAQGPDAVPQRQDPDGSAQACRDGKAASIGQFRPRQLKTAATTFPYRASRWSQGHW